MRKPWNVIWHNHRLLTMIGSSAAGVRASRRVIVVSLAIVAAVSGSFGHGERVKSGGMSTL
jgi:hypothetical protein